MIWYPLKFGEEVLKDQGTDNIVVVELCEVAFFHLPLSLISYGAGVLLSNHVGRVHHLLVE
jgi:hypothetical protein